MKKFSLFCLAVIVLCLSQNATSQRPSASTPVVTAEDYARAEKMLGTNTNPLVDRNA